MSRSKSNNNKSTHPLLVRGEGFIVGEQSRNTTVPFIMTLNGSGRFEVMTSLEDIKDALNTEINQIDSLEDRNDIIVYKITPVFRVKPKRIVELENITS
jgi:hypothetical protein